MMRTQASDQTCFSQWIGRPNPADNLGLMGDGDQIDFFQDVAVAFGVKLDDADFRTVASLSDLQTLVQTAVTAADQDAAWPTIVAIARDHATATITTFTPDFQLYDRLYD